MAKKTKRSAYTHYELGIYHGISFKLIVPSKFNKEKYPNYFIQYDGSEKHYTGIKALYFQYASFEQEHQTIASLIELFLPIIQGEILPLTTNKTVPNYSIRITSLVTDAINSFFTQQVKLFEIGELIDISDYRDRNKKLNDYFGNYLNDKLRLCDLTRQTWLEFRYYLLKSYKIKSNSTVNQYITYVKSFYNWLQNDQEIVIGNHVLKLKRLDTSKQKPKYDFIDHKLVNEFLDTLRSDERWLRLNIVSLLVFENAKRPVQAYRLQAKDIDLRNKTLLLSSKSRNKGKELTIISDELAELIQKIYHNTINKGKTIAEDDYLLGGGNCFKRGGKEISQGDIRDLQIVPFRIQYPKFKDLLIYSLKHTTITSIAQYDLGLAQRMANHSNQSTTEIYDRKRKSSSAIPRKKLVKEFKLL